MTSHENPETPKQTLTTSQRAALTSEKVKATKAMKREHDKAALEKVIKIVRELRKIKADMTLNQALVFLEVAARAGRHGMVENLEVRERTGYSSAIFTPLMHSLTDGSYQRGTEKEYRGIGLVDLTASDTDGRAKSLFLTEKGRKLADGIIFLIS